VRDAEAGEIDVLVVVDVDRLTRTDDMRARADPRPRSSAPGSVATPSGGVFDLRSMLGELYVTLQALFAAEENRKRAERIKAGKLRAIAEGRKPAGPTPYGLLRYERATARGRSRARPIMREIFVRVDRRRELHAIADDLAARGVPGPRGKPVEPALGLAARPLDAQLRRRGSSTRRAG
jgi:site-specific DNA recombinase